MLPFKLVAKLLFIEFFNLTWQAAAHFFPSQALHIWLDNYEGEVIKEAYFILSGGVGKGRKVALQIEITHGRKGKGKLEELS